MLPDEFFNEITIHGCQLSIPRAIACSMSHNSYHIGQIVQTARILACEDRQTLSIPRGKSE
ncbi:DUF1572 family protein [Adhaeretor mobilis]|uniref:DUF1572 family protein n=1 Tax=Adhaeretor mobilis TaxID=1930276 RepID=UPI00119D7AD5